MSQRVKRPNRSEDASVPAKRRKRTAAEEEEAVATLAAAAAAAGGGAWPRPNDLKGIYNRSTTEAPAELFRKDLISAMKLPDSEPLAADEYWLIVDQWKQEWERGVQVPVNPDSLPEPLVTVNRAGRFRPRHDFRLPKNKYIRITKDENFKPEEHVLSHAPAKSEAACSYDLDECDVAWLKIFNAERASAGLGPVYEEQLERVIERMELCCWDRIQSILRDEEGMGIEYDENVICDVCRSPDSEEGNEMVFCDSCNICVHQACYGITRIPDGQWLCCTCNLGKRPECVLCPNKGGAMKCLRTGKKWAHVSCALWIPEVSIGCVEKMEPITKVSSIPQSRWALICVLCRERVGACIQCSVKTCKTAYHVTCAFKHGLEMRAIIEDENADDGVKLRSYCEKHSKSGKKEKSICSGSEDDDSKRKKRKEMTSEEKNQARAARLQEIEAEFFKHVTIKDVSIHLNLDNDALQYIYNYWKLKRKAGFNRPLLPPKSEDVDMLSQKREQADLEKMKMFVQLRQDLERVRNLCYMVSRREKLSRTFFRMREQTFHKQAAVLESSHSLQSTVIEAVIEANHGPSIYDRLYSHNGAEDHTTDFDTILARIAGVKSPTNSGDESKAEMNGLFKDVKNNPYKKIYYNGSSKRRSASMYGSSMSSASSEDDKPKKDDKENRLLSSSEEDETPSMSDLSKKKTTPSPHKPNNNIGKVPDRRKTKKSNSSQGGLESSSEEDLKPAANKDWGHYSKSRLRQVEKELGETGSESDELMPIRSSQRGAGAKNIKSMSSIYSDSDSSDESTRNDDKSSNATNDSRKPRTKAAVKDFSHKPSAKTATKDGADSKKRAKNEEVKVESASKKNDYVPSDLIVPQRQAAKKATENLKTTTTTVSRTKEHVPPTEDSAKAEEKPKQKPKGKPNKDVHPKEDEEKVKEKEVRETLKEKKKETKASPSDVDMEKETEKVEPQEILAYVPQRQAAKKAAEHIKSGLGKTVPPPPEPQPPDNEKPSKKEVDTAKPKKADAKKESEPAKVAKVPDSKRKSSTNSTSSSSSSTSSSSDSSGSSSSESEDEEEPVKRPPQSESLFSSPVRETTKRTTAADWPFLDKGPRPAATSGSSSSSDSSVPSSPTKSSPPPSHPKADSPSRAATPKSIRRNNKKPRPPSPQQPRGRAPRAVRGRASRPSADSGDRIGNADVGSRDLSDGQRVGVEAERGRGRKGKQTAARNSVDDKVNKEAAQPSIKVSSPLGKTDKQLSREPEIGKLEKEILERKAGKDAGKSKTSTLDRLFGTQEKTREEKKPDKSDLIEKSERAEEAHKGEKPRRESFEKHTRAEKPLIAPEKLIIREKVAEEKSQPHLEKSLQPSEDNNMSKQQENAVGEIVPEALPILLDETPKVLSKSPSKEIREPVDKKLEHKDDKKSANKKPQSKNRSIDDLLANKLLSSDTKENKVDSNKPPTPKQPKPTDEITIADKIVEDHLQSHKANDFYNRQPEVQEIFHAQPDITKNFLNELDTDKRNNLKPTGLTNQVLQNRSIFSPQPHVKEATDFLDLVSFDDDMGISKDDDITKGPLTWNFSNTNLIREDTKEESARETLNLVEKLRMGLSKKSTVGEVSDTTTSSEIDNEKIDFMEQVVPVSSSEPSNKDVGIESHAMDHLDLQLKVPLTELEQSKAFENVDKPPEQQPHADYPYLNAESNPSLEPPPKSVPIPQQDTLTDHPAPLEGDERWVPPSGNYPNMPPHYLNDPAQHALYLEAYVNAATQDHHKKPPLNALPPQLDVRLHGDPLKSQSPSRIDRRISQTPLIDPTSMDCMNSPMPYSNIHPQAKWADCEIIPNRRSSSSSAASSTSSGSRRDDEEARLQDVRMVNHAALDVASYMPPQGLPYPPNSIDNFGGFSDGSCYPVSLFPPPNLNTQLSFPPSGPAAMFPPAFAAPFPTPHAIPPVPKPMEETIPPFSASCTAAFTSSEHNMALTAAMVNLPPTTSKPTEQRSEEDRLLGPPAEAPPCSQSSLTPTTPAAEKVEVSPALSNTTPTANSALPSPSTSSKSNSSTGGKKSPSKPTRTSARVTSQMMNKSPAKSPGKSPRQETALKQSGPGRGKGESKRGSGKSGFARGAANLRGGRGRGRGRGRGGHHAEHDFVGIGTIHNKLAGTVYDLDFEDDICNDNMADLKSMRERRRSVDVHDRKFDAFGSARSSSRSPKFSSPSQASHKSRNYSTDLRELRPPTPIEDSRSKTDVSLAGSDNDAPHVFPDVTPPLPGPVDMRTYNSNNFDQQTYNEQNLLSAFASGTTETQVQEIDEDFEKELQTVLSVKKPVETASRETASNIKVSLSDSRNQLKVKIKGPIANYASSVAPLPPATVDPIIVVTNVNSAMNNAMNISSGAMSSSGGPSSLRRMRKKELLRQYWTQDMNMDEPAGNLGYTAPTAPPIRSTIITIPKAVASMTSIPTKEDYRDYRTDPDDVVVVVDSKHHRKESKARQALSRELRQLDLPTADYDGGHPERRRSSLANNSCLSSSFESNGSNKRRGRPPRLPPQQQQQLTPKLTIKIGTGSGGTNSIVGPTRPPKKRLAATLSKPSVEDLKRESMKFRKMIRKDLKIKKHKKRDKSEKKKRRKLESEIRIIPMQSDNQIKMTIRIGKKSDSDADSRRTSGETNEVEAKCAKDTAGDSDRLPLKVTPIKLKLARCQEGTGYMMKPAIASSEKEAEVRSVQPGQPPPPEPGQPPPGPPPAPPIANKDCEVR